MRLLQIVLSLCTFVFATTIASAQQRAGICRFALSAFDRVTIYEISDTPQKVSELDGVTSSLVWDANNSLYLARVLPGGTQIERYVSEENTVQPVHYLEEIYTVEIAPDVAHIAYSNDNLLFIASLPDVEAGVTRFEMPPDSSIKRLTWSPDSTALAVFVGEPGSDEGQLWLIDIIRDKISHNEIETLQITPGSSVTWSPDGMYVAWENHTGELNPGSADFALAVPDVAISIFSTQTFTTQILSNADDLVGWLSVDEMIYRDGETVFSVSPENTENPTAIFDLDASMWHVSLSSGNTYWSYWSSLTSSESEYDLTTLLYMNQLILIHRQTGQQIATDVIALPSLPVWNQSC